MRTSKRLQRPTLAATMLVFLGASVVAQLEIVRSTVDGGGGMHSTGGSFELSGTIGQPDVGVMAGGGFEVTGGFWFHLGLTDCNEDGRVDLADYASLSECLGGPGAAVSSGCDCFDIDRSGTIDLSDSAVLQIHFSQ